jgi:hypothetical protein
VTRGRRSDPRIASGFEAGAAFRQALGRRAEWCCVRNRLSEEPTSIRDRSAAPSSAFCLVALAAVAGALLQHVLSGQEVLRQAERSVEKSQSTSSSDAVKSYDDAIKRAGKVLACHEEPLETTRSTHGRLLRKASSNRAEEFDELLANIQVGPVPRSLHERALPLRSQNYEEMKPVRLLEKEPDSGSGRDSLTEARPRRRAIRTRRSSAITADPAIPRLRPRGSASGISLCGPNTAPISYTDLAHLARTDQVHRTP